MIQNSDRIIEVKIKLGKPYESEQSMWSCQVELAGLNPSYHNIAGGDAFQALSRSLEFIGRRLKDTVHPNGKIYFGDSNRDAGHSFPIEYYFPDWAPSEDRECLECKDTDAEAV